MMHRNILELARASIPRSSITLIVAACCSFALSLLWYFTYFPKVGYLPEFAFRGVTLCFFYTTHACGEIATFANSRGMVAFAPYLTWLGLLFSILAVLERGGPARTGPRVATIAGALFFVFAAVAAAKAVTGYLELELPNPSDDFFSLFRFVNEDTLPGLFFFAILLCAGLAIRYRWREWYLSSSVVASVMILLVGFHAIEGPAGGWNGQLEPIVVAAIFVFVLWAVRQAERQTRRG